VLTGNRPRLWSIEKQLSIAKENVIILPTANKVFLSDILTKLNTFRDDYNMKVYCFDRLKDFDNIDVAYFENLNVHLLTNYLVLDTNRFEGLETAFQKEYNNTLDKQ
jgi:hypothetical protein